MPSPISRTLLQEESIARAVAGGMGEDAICAFHDITPAAYHALLRRPSFLAIVERFREKQRLAMQMSHAYLIQLLPDAFSAIAQAIESGTSKERLDSAWKVVNKFAADASLQRGDLNVTAVVAASPESVAAIADGIKGLLEAKARGQAVDLDDDPHFHPA